MTVPRSEVTGATGVDEGYGHPAPQRDNGWLTSWRGLGKSSKRLQTTSRHRSEGPTQVDADHQISFSAADTRGISMPHNDSLLIDIGIGECQVTKVLVDTGSSVDLIF